MKKSGTTISGRLFDVVNYLFLFLFMLICVYPFYYILIYSISDTNKVAKGIFLLPAGFSLGTYTAIFRLNDISSAFFVSLSRTLIGTAITVFCSSLFSYVLTKKELYVRKLIYRTVIVTMYLNAGLIPWYITMKALGLKNSFFLYIIPGAVSAFYIILIKTYIEQLPASMEESAMMDGAGYFRIFAKIIFPLSKPIIATIAVFSAVGQWNNWFDNYFLVTNTKLQTLQLVLYRYLSAAQAYATKSTEDIMRDSGKIKITSQSIKMCITMIVTVPIILVYPFMQKYFVKGIMLGAVKG